MDKIKSEKDLVIKLGPDIRDKSEAILREVNKGNEFKKKISFKELYEHLVVVHGESSVSALYKSRELPEDRLKVLFEKSGTDLSYEEWLLGLAEKGAGIKKKAKKIEKQIIKDKTQVVTDA